MSHPYYLSPKQDQHKSYLDYKEELPTFFGQLQIQKDSLRGKRVLECVR